MKNLCIKNCILKISTVKIMCEFFFCLKELSVLVIDANVLVVVEICPVWHYHLTAQSTAILKELSQSPSNFYLFINESQCWRTCMAISFRLEKHLLTQGRTFHDIELIKWLKIMITTYPSFPPSEGIMFLNIFWNKNAKTSHLITTIIIKKVCFQNNE